MFEDIKTQFPTLKNNPELAYFDSAASTQTHISVLKAMDEYYNYERCNIHRGDYAISRTVSDKVDTAREQIADLINASPENIIFTSGATDGLNIIAEWFKDIKTVFITEAEHSANILPWLAQGRSVNNGKLIVIPVNDNGSVNLDILEKLFESNPGSLLSMLSTSNVTGVNTQWEKIAEIAKRYNISVCIDACQTISTHKIDVTNNFADFIVFSGHKMFGPPGIGALYSRHDVSALRAVRFGGGTVHHYDFNGNVEFYEGPMKHEPGTPNIAGIIGMGIAAEWINYIGYDNINTRLNQINSWLGEAGLFGITDLFCGYSIDWVEVETNQGHSRNIRCFNTGSIHPNDLGPILGNNNVATRAGKLCAHPYVNKISNNGVLRVSWHIYNTKEDCIKLVDELCKATNKLK